MEEIIIETQQKGMFVVKEVDINIFLKNVYQLFEEDKFVSEYLDMTLESDMKYYFSRRIIKFRNDKLNKKQFFKSDFRRVYGKIMHFAMERGLMEKGVYISNV